MTSSAPDTAPSLWRHLLAVGVLPALVAGVVPALLVLAYGTKVGWSLPDPVGLAPAGAGAALILAGLRLMYETISLFWRVGEGTLAPWDPTRRLVLRGPYLRVRNPMITGVAVVLLGEVALLGSIAILIELGLFALANATYIPLVEEPGLVRRFGAEYDQYRSAVPRWIPRRTPWAPSFRD